MMVVYKEEELGNARILDKDIMKVQADAKYVPLTLPKMTFNTLITKAYFCNYQSKIDSCGNSYFKNVAQDLWESSQFSHYFCGEHSIRGAWCPNCNKPLLRLLKLDMEDARLHLKFSRVRIIPLLYCWTCSIAQDYFSYQIIDEDQIVIIDFGQGGCEVDFPYENYPTFFPGAPACLAQISPDAQELLINLNRNTVSYSTAYAKYPELTKARHQVGGEPLLMQRDRDYQDEKDQLFSCSRCGDKMPFFASIGNDCLDSRGISGNDYVQVIYHYCEECRVVGCINRTD